MVFAVSVAASLVGVLLASGGAFLINEFGVGMRSGADLAIYYLPGAVFFAGATAVATWRLRAPSTRRSLKRDATLSLIAIALTPVVILGTILLGCSISYCGA